MDCSSESKEKFDWDSYLENRQVAPVPNFAFQHVEQCQQSLLEEGMLVEVRHPTSHLPKFWLANVSMKCGPFLRLKYFGLDDTSKEFWTDPLTAEIHPVGFCSSHGLCLEPPNELKSAGSKLLEKAVALVNQFKVNDCDISLLSPSQQMKTGLTLEIEDLNEPRTVWVCTITKNIGGRLLVTYALPPNVSANEPIIAKKWIFCLSPRLHYLGWGSLKSWSYRPPTCLRQLCATNARGLDYWQVMADKFQTNTSSSDLSFSKETLRHTHQVGDKINCPIPTNPISYVSASVVEVVDDQRFTIQFDSDDSEKATFCCFAENEGNIEEDSGFQDNMVLEAVNPWKPADIHVATIIAIKDGLLEVRLETTSEVIIPNILIPMSSYDIFPVGWCESQQYPLQGPINIASANQPSLMDISPTEPVVHQPETEQPSGVSYWCPKIYFNFRCFSGPLLSKVRIAALPQSVGPGPVLLVMKEVLSLLVNGAYKPGGVLKQMQGEPGGSIPKGTQLEPLKAKYKQTTYRASIPIASTAADVVDYCLWVCDKLQCCPYLFGPELVGDPCPNRCCILAKASWQNKKKAPNWRHRRFVDILKNLPLLDNDVAKTCPAEMDGHSDEEAFEATEGQETSQNESLNADRSIFPQAESGEDAKKGKQFEEVVVKKKRGRPRKHPLKQELSDPVVHPVKVEFTSKLKSRTVSSPLSLSPTSPPSPSPLSCSASQGMKFPELRVLNVDSDPLCWRPKDLWHFMRSSDCGCLADRLLHLEMDGVAFMMLSLPTVMDHVTLNFDLALRLCYLVGCLRLTYYQRFQIGS